MTRYISFCLLRTLVVVFFSGPLLHGQEAILTPASALERLKQGNRRFATDNPAARKIDHNRRAELAAGQQPFAVVLACADSRVAPELVFDQGLGDLFVIRVAGNIADRAGIGSIEYAVEQLRVPLVVVLGHESCGAVKAALEGKPLPGDLGWLIQRVHVGDVPAGNQETRMTAGARSNVLNAARTLTQRSSVLKERADSKRLQIVSAIYSLTTGKVDWLETPRANSGAGAIFAPDAQLKIEASDGAAGEGPAWDPKLGILTSGNGHIYQLDRSGTSRIYRKNAGTNGLLFDREGRLLACEPVQRRITRTETDGPITVLTDRYEGHRYNEPNDLTLDSAGRIYFSDPRYGLRAGKDIRDERGRIIEGVYRIDPDGTVTRIIGRELERPNGLLVSADDRFLYVADNNNNQVGGARKLWRFDLRKDGSVALDTKKLLYDWGEGRGPDGLKQDQKGRLYVAAGLSKPNPPFEPGEGSKGGIYVLAPEGKLLAFLPVPRDEVTNCGFGGDDLKTLYITAGGTLYSIPTLTPGRVIWPAGK